MYFDLSYTDLYQYFLNSYYEFPDNINHSLNSSTSFKIKKIQGLQDLVEPLLSMSFVDSIVSAMNKTYDLLDYPSDPQNFYELSGSEIINYAQRNMVTGNCITHSSLLVDILKTMGYNARILRCLPLDIHFTDCHVITEVYSEEWHKWVYLDPSNRAFFLGKDQIMLSTMEIRQMLASGQNFKSALVINIDTPNLKFKKLILEKYFSYLTKNFIRFEIIDKSSGIIYRLNPLNYYHPIKKVKNEKISICGSMCVKKIVYIESFRSFWGLEG